MKTSIIAEIGWNHMGNMRLAEEMIISAKASGCEIAKFQTWKVERLADGEWDHDGRREIYKNAELSYEKHEFLKNICSDNSIEFLSSAFSVQDAQLLKKLNCESIKIPSFEVNNFKLLEYSKNNFKRIFISTGTATKEEILKVKDFFSKWDGKLIVMHCVSAYPCKPERINLPRIAHLKNHFDDVGFSDHTQGIKSTISSISFNPIFIEKHFTIDQNLPGRDNKFAILPSDMKFLSEYIKDREKNLIDLGIDYQDIEESSRKYYRGRFNG